MNHLVVFIPGIGGSVLRDPGGSRWSRWSGSVVSGFRMLLQPEAMSLAEAPTLRATGLVRDIQIIPGWSVVHAYSTLIKRLRSLGLRLDEGDPDRPDLLADVLLFPYDFRLGVVPAAERLASSIEERLVAGGAGPNDHRVIVIGHSMGGLVARYWLGPLRGWRHCRALLTLGTPHRGAPKALSLAGNGISVAGIRLGSLTQVLLDWPAIADLLPAYRGVQSIEGSWHYPHELSLANATAARRSVAMHADIAAAWEMIPRGPPQTLAMAGWSHPTPTAMTWNGSRVKVTTARTQLLSTGSGWSDLLGDGTVPAFSAVPQELSTHAPDGMLSPLRHGPLSADDRLFSLLTQFSTFESLAAVRDDASPPWSVGLDLPELHVTDVPLRLSAIVHGPPVDPESITVWYRVTTTDSGELVTDGRLNRCTDGYEAQLSFDTPAIYKVTVVVRGFPSGIELRCGDVVGVMRL